MNPIQAVTIVAQGGTPMQLCDQRGAPYPTTGFGALVFNTGAHLIDPTIEGGTLNGVTLNDPIVLNPSFPLLLNQLGDLITFDGTNPQRLPMGAPDTLLTSTPTGLQWKVDTARGTVTQINPGTGIVLTPNPITATGSIALADTAVAPGTYGDTTHVGQFTVDQQGRLVFAGSVAIALPPGGVTNVSVATANGFAGTVVNPTTTPVITISTTVTGLLKGDGTGVSAAIPGTDYMTPGNVSGLYLPITNPTYLGTLTGPAAVITGASNVERRIAFQTLGVQRWLIGANAIGESAPANGSDFVITSFNNAGAQLQNALSITRATGAAIFAGPITSFDTITSLAGLSGTTGTFTGKVTTPASAAGGAGLIMPHGAAPSAPVNGDLWTTTGGLFARINGGTVGPFGVAGAGGPPTGAAGGDLASTYPNPTLAWISRAAAQTLAIGTGGTLGSNAFTSTAFAPLSSPVFTGDPQAPTPATADNDTSIATTAFVKAQGYAPLASPIFTGDPQAPTPATADNDTSISTTAFVKAQGYLTTAAAGTTYLPLAGGTLTGDLTLSKASLPTLNLVSTDVDSWKSRIQFFQSATLKWQIGVDINDAGQQNLFFYDAVTGGGATRAYFDNAGLNVIGTGTFSGTLSGTTGIFNTNLQVGTPGVEGYVLLNEGGPVNAGYVAWFNTAGVRQGYIGFALPGLQYTSEAGPHVFTGDAIFSGGVASTSVGATAPASPVDRQLWWNSDGSAGGGQLYIRYNDGNTTQWVPAVAPTVVGGILGRAVTDNTGYGNVTGTIPADNTIPQISEGTAHISLAYTVKVTGSKLRIKYHAEISSSGAMVAIMALFRDSNVNAIRTCYSVQQASNWSGTLEMDFEYVHGSTSGTVVNLSTRLGTNTSIGMFINGYNGGALFGGTNGMFLSVEEYM